MAEQAERTTWVFDRVEARANGGMVAAKSVEAAEAGATVLRSGGNAVDAAVTTAFVSGVVEPWMSGIGGGGFLVAHRPGEPSASVVEFPMVAPARATPEMFPLSGTGPDMALFGWAGVVDNANIVGHRAVAVPGVVAGLALALERFGTISLANALAPAIEIAESGWLVTWSATKFITRDIANLSRFPETAKIFLDARGYPPFTLDGGHPTMLRQRDLAATLRLIADQGPRVFYEGELAARILAELTANGSPFEASDFAQYGASVVPALTVPYGDYRVATTGKGSGGTTLAESLAILDQLGIGQHDHNSAEALHAIAQAFRLAFVDRFTYLADPDHVHVPWETLVSADYAAERAALVQVDGSAAVQPGDRERLGVHHDLRPSMQDYATGGSTTHLGAIDRSGMAVSLTQTLLSGWGSRVTVPGSGMLLNNGMMWFDPEPGHPNSVAGSKRPLSNMAPMLLLRGNDTVASIGSSGGRRILNCNAQVVMNLVDHGLSPQPAISAPRIDASTPDLLVSARLPRETRDALAAKGHTLAMRDEIHLHGEFASAVMIQRDGQEFRGGADPYYPAMAVGVDGNR